MSNRVKLEIAGSIAALVVVVVLFAFWLRAREARIHAEATQQAQDVLIKNSQQTFQQQQQQIQSLADSIKQIQADNAKQLADLSKQFAQANNPTQIAALATQLMKLGQPIQIVTPAPTKDNPNPQPVAEIPLPDAPAAKAYLQQCEICKVNLDSATKQLAAVQAQSADKDTQLKAKDQDISSLTQERDQWEKAAKGGSWIHRAAKAIVVAACAGGGAAAGSGRGSKASAIGAIGGAIVCSVAMK